MIERTLVDDLLADAVAAHQAGRLERAEDGYRRVLARQPDNANALNLLGLLSLDVGRVEDAIALARRAAQGAPDVAAFQANLGTALMADQRMAEAEEAFRRAMSLGCDRLQAPFNLGLLLMHESRPDEAAAAFREAARLDPQNEEVAFLLAALSGDQRESAPASYVVGLFDSYAYGFEKHVVERLGYDVPVGLRSLVERHAPTGGAWRVVDIGCGTGLCGAAFRDLARHLSGCDVSPRMVEVARQRGLYDAVEVADLVQFLLDTRAAGARTDLVVAGDVFIYVGALERAFDAVLGCVRDSGYLAFSIETHAGEGVRLRTSGRFAHAPAYIQDLAARTGFDVVEVRDVVIRKEAGQPIPGQLYLLRA